MIDKGFLRKLHPICLSLMMVSCAGRNDLASEEPRTAANKDCNPYQVLILEAERDFMRRLPEMVQESSDTKTLVRELKLRAAQEGHGTLAIEETPEGVRWGWLLVTIDMKAKAIRKVDSVDCSQAKDKFECSVGISTSGRENNKSENVRSAPLR